MVSYISASYIYPVAGDPIKKGVIAVDADGTIVDVLTETGAIEQQIKDIKHYDGLLVPGFVNTHCHLELSHLKGQIEKHSGLVNFVQGVMKLRTSDEHALERAMLKADAEMFENGIVAVGDISNLEVSKMIKQGSPLYYHTFIEIMGFNPDTAAASIKRALAFKEKFEAMPASIVPHAPYSVSEQLFNELKRNKEKAGALLSIHNQESADENAFFQNKTGDFLKLYEFLGLNIDFYRPSGKTSLQTVLPLLSPEQKTLLVHNTYASEEDVVFAETLHPDLYWCFCVGANLYIEGRMPDVNMFRKLGVKVTLGTDSLASNGKLSIFAEMEMLQDHFDVPVADLIKWGTWNGAEFLGITDRYGSLEPGKRPGINLLKFKEAHGRVTLDSGMERLF